MGAISGYQRGLIKSFAGFIGIGLAIWAGLNFSTLLENFVDQQEAIPDNLVKIVALLATIGLVYLGIKLVSKIIHSTVHTIGLGVFNRLGGAVFSVLLSAIALCALVYYLFPFFDWGSDSDAVKTSKTLPYLMEMADFLKSILF